jgi:phosphate transport system protein
MREPTIETIQDEVVQLSASVTEAILSSVKALVERDELRARQVSADDAYLNQLRFIIEEHCYALLLHSPLPLEQLRAVVGMINVATNLERIGDYAAGIAHLVTQLTKKPGELVIPVALPPMAEVAREMVEGAVEAYLTDNDLLAESIVRRDREIDELQEQVYRELAITLGREPAGTDPSTLLLWVSQHLERIGDRAMNICERAIYVTTGELKEFR